MNQNNEDQNKKADQTSGLRDDDLQTEKTQQNTSKLDEEWTE
jgi:hypothetical protein